ncbi:MAG: conjugal transfer protein TraX [Christensenellaceae bacterium]|jgi:hypothetical protein|nr:conjugal transfer protein TraX [Christensenellaceae bacterium]
MMTWLKKGLSGGAIKLLATVLMVFDHVHQMFVQFGAPGWLKWLGRPVAPIFLFMCAEGMAHTRNRKRYLLQLLIGFEAMNILSFCLGRLMPSEAVLMNSIFGTLFLTGLYIAAADLLAAGIKAKKWGKAALAVLIMLAPVLSSAVVLVTMSNETLVTAAPWLVYIVFAIPSFISTEGGFLFPLLGLAFYLLRNYRWARLLPLAAFSAFCFAMGDWLEGLSVFAVPILLLYNGEKGESKHFFQKKYFFYAFYPGHIYFLYILAWLVANLR